MVYKGPRKPIWVRLGPISVSHLPIRCFAPSHNPKKRTSRASGSRLICFPTVRPLAEWHPRTSLGMLSPLKSAAMQSGQTNHPSQNEAGLDVSHHIHLSLEGREKYFFLDILFHRMSVMAIWNKPRFAGGGNV